MIIICGFHICTEAGISMITLGYLDDVIFHKRVERENLMTKERENSNLTFLIFLEIIEIYRNIEFYNHLHFTCTFYSQFKGYDEFSIHWLYQHIGLFLEIII